MVTKVPCHSLRGNDRKTVKYYRRGSSVNIVKRGVMSRCVPHAVSDVLKNERKCNESQHQFYEWDGIFKKIFILMLI